MLTYNQNINVLKEVLCDAKTLTKDEILQRVDMVVDSLQLLQQDFLLIRRNVILETGE